MTNRNGDAGPNADWRAGLRGFFQDIADEDRVLADRLVRAAKFYAGVVKPALDAAGQELTRYGRKYETGGDTRRSYIIVRDVGGEVEFQYAVVAEVKIEGITPYVHCWYEEAQGSTEEAKQHGEGNSGADGDSESRDKGKAGGDEKSGHGSGGAGEDGKDKKEEEEKSSRRRIKTIEPLAGWTSESDLDLITREQIASDFLEHYKSAVLRLRAHLHAAPRSGEPQGHDGRLSDER